MASDAATSFVSAFDGLIRSRTKGTGGVEYANKCKRDMAEALDELFRPLTAFLDPDHTVNLLGNGWTLAHPFSCRPNLHDCEVHRIISDEVAEHERRGVPMPTGKFKVELTDEGTLAWTEIARE